MGVRRGCFVGRGIVDMRCRGLSSSGIQPGFVVVMFLAGFGVEMAGWRYWLGVVSSECIRKVTESSERWSVLMAVSSLNRKLRIGVLCRLGSCFAGVVVLVLLHVVKTVG